MVKFETLNELTLKVTADAGDVVFSKAGAWVGGECYGQKNYKFDKRLLGPEGNPVQALMGQLGRRLTGENLPIMEMKCQGPSITYYANEAQHVVVIKLQPGQQLNVESENILAFTSDCKYGIRFLGTGVLSQKGLATSTFKANGPNAMVAVLVDGNPVALSNEQNGSTIEVDPDAMVCFTGQAEPGLSLNVSWKNLIGQASGESYMLQWTGQKPTTVIIQPNERKSGIDIGMDGKGGKPTRQDNNLFRQDGNQMMNNLGMGGGNPLGGGNSGGTNGLGGLGGIIGGILNS